MIEQIIDSKGQDGLTPLQIALEEKNEIIVDFLLENGQYKINSFCRTNLLTSTYSLVFDRCIQA